MGRYINAAIRAVTNIMIRNAILFNGSTIDENDNPEIGKLIEVTLPWISGRSKFLCVLCGTKRKFVVGVPQNIMTALDAQAWITGLDPKDFQSPEIRT
jgi:hypothetical protein